MIIADVRHRAIILICQEREDFGATGAVIAPTSYS
jgi:hypothetical protein